MLLFYALKVLILVLGPLPTLFRSVCGSVEGCHEGYTCKGMTDWVSHAIMIVRMLMCQLLAPIYYVYMHSYFPTQFQVRPMQLACARLLYGKHLLNQMVRSPVTSSSSLWGNQGRSLKPLLLLQLLREHLGQL